jgi:hypothetical protein
MRNIYGNLDTFFRKGGLKNKENFVQCFEATKYGLHFSLVETARVVCHIQARQKRLNALKLRIRSSDQSFLCVKFKFQNVLRLEQGSFSHGGFYLRK